MISSTAIAVLITLPIMILILKPAFPARVVGLLKIIALLVALGVLLTVAKGNQFLPFIMVLFFAWLLIIKTVGKKVWLKIKSFLQTPVIKSGWHKAQRIIDHGIIDVEGFEAAYYRTILRIISSRSARIKVIVAILIYAIVSFSLLPLGLVKNEFFPKSDQETIYVSIELPAGNSLDTTYAEASRVLDDLRHTEHTEFVVAEIGRGISADGGRENSSNGVLFSVHLPKAEERSISSMELGQTLREKFASYTAGKTSVIEVSGGPPAGADLQIKLLGDDLSTLDSYASKITEFLSQEPGVTNVDKSIKTGTSQLVFVPDLARLADAGISIDQIGLWLRMYASGFTLDSVRWGGNDTEKQDIVFKMSNNPSVDNLSSLEVTNSRGTSYPLNALGHWEARPNPTQITRENGSRTISVTATVVSGYSPTELNKKLEAFADTIELPQGYSWATGGVNEENEKSVTSILQAMVVAAILILVTMVIQFGSFRQAFIVLLVIPLAVSSVFFIFALTGTPLSFPALIGVLSLFGIVVTNSMFIVDKINLNQKQGMPLKEAIADAGSSRLEPIILTKLCTVLGLLPITISDPLWRGLGGAIISGLLISSTIMLLFIPSVYYQMFKNEK